MSLKIFVFMVIQNKFMPQQQLFGKKLKPRPFFYHIAVSNFCRRYLNFISCPVQREMPKRMVWGGKQWVFSKLQKVNECTKKSAEFEINILFCFSDLEETYEPKFKTKNKSSDVPHTISLLIYLLSSESALTNEKYRLKFKEFRALLS